MSRKVHVSIKKHNFLRYEQQQRFLLMYFVTAGGLRPVLFAPMICGLLMVFVVFRLITK